MKRINRYLKIGLTLSLVLLVGYFLLQNRGLAFGLARSTPDDLEAARLALEGAIANEKALLETEADQYALHTAAEEVDRALANYNHARSLQLNGVPAAPNPKFIPEVEPNGAINGSNAQVIALGADGCAIVDGAITPNGDIDIYKITAASGSKIWTYVDTGGTQNPNSQSRDLTMRVFRSDGVPIEQDLDDGTGNGLDNTIETGQSPAIAGATLSGSSDNVYFIEVNEFLFNQRVDPYRLFIVVRDASATAEVEANGTVATANPLLTNGGPMNAVRSGEVENGGTDYYSVYAEAR